MNVRRFIPFVVFIMIMPLLVSGQSSNLIQSYTVKVNPRGTYLLTNQDETIIRDPNNPQVIQEIRRPLPASSFLLSRGSPEQNINTGDILYLMGEGEFNYDVVHNTSLEGRNLLGVFSGSSGYVSPGPRSDSHIGVVSTPTFRGNLSTDISQDFYIPFNESNCVKVEVPENVDRILFSVNDRFFSDNGDIDNDFKSNIKILKTQASVGYSNPRQVIFAPQLDASQPYYDQPYDLVEGKPFAIGVGFHKLTKTLGSSDNNPLFEPIIKINGIKRDVKCASKRPNDDGSSGCSFRGSDFTSVDEPQGEDGNFGTFSQNFLIPGDMLPAGDHTIEVNLYPEITESDFPCDTSVGLRSKFDVRVHKVKAPKIALARTHCSHISGCDSVSSAQYNKFSKSKHNMEIDLFKTMFPVPENKKMFFKLNYMAQSGTAASVEEVINSHQPPLNDTEKEKIRKDTLLAFSINNINLKRIISNHDYILALGTSTFFNHVLPANLNAFGFIMKPFGKPFHKIGFVRTDRINKGTMLHELGHILGQRKEFYEERIPRSFCTRHDLKIEENNMVPTLCHKLRPFGGYDTSSKEFIYRQYSIMDSGSKPLPEKWMDRDTFITTFNHLKNPALDPALTVVSGIYVDGVGFFNPEIVNYGAGLLEPLSAEGDLRIMLKDSSGNILSESRTSTSVEIELLNGQGGGYVTSSVVPITMTFPYQAQASQLVIMKVENETETMIYSQNLTPDINPEYLLSSDHTYSTEENFPVLRRISGANLTNKRHTNAGSAIFSKFIYSPALRVAFDYNACGNSPSAGDGIALFFGKDPGNYSDNFPQSNQGVSSNNSGFSLHLDMKSNEIQLKNHINSVVARISYQVSTGCDNWRKLKVRINRNGKLIVLQGTETLLEFKLSWIPLEELSSHPIGWSAYSGGLGQYRIKSIHIDRIPFERKETNTEAEEE